LRQRITCNFALDAKCIEFLKERAAIHLRQDWNMLRELRRRDPTIAFSARYAMAYSAMKEFALAGTEGYYVAAFRGGRWAYGDSRGLD
jgi:hypothetical protein